MYSAMDHSYLKHYSKPLKRYGSILTRRKQIYLLVFSRYFEIKKPQTKTQNLKRFMSFISSNILMNLSQIYLKLLSYLKCIAPFIRCDDIKCSDH